MTILAAAAMAVVGLRAGTPGAPEPEEFGSYHAGIGATLDAMLARTRQQPAQTGTPAADASGEAPQFDSTRRFAQRYWGGKEAAVRAALTRLNLLRPAIEPVLLREGLPPGLISVVLVESGAQAMALSPKDARGLWQLVPETARRYGLNVDPGSDDRLDIERASTAAARYLRDLHQRFGNWPLALAGYNAGEQAVQRALDRAEGADFWRLSALRLLPDETRNYVPAVLAAQEMLGGGLLSPAVPRAKARTVYASTSPGESAAR